MLTNNYRRLHGMPMVHTKRYPHQSRFKKRYGFSLSEWFERFKATIAEISDAFSEFAVQVGEAVRRINNAT